LHGPLLAAVSRSFYLSLRFLPRQVRGALSVSYLLARAADTIADVEASAAEVRLGLLAGFQAALSAAPGGRDPDFFTKAAAFAAAVDHAGEKELLERLPECFGQLSQLNGASRARVVGVLEHILHGMTLDLHRFPDASRLRCLAVDPDLEEYTWLVAGCVGEFWTAICADELPGVFTRSVSRMTALGGQFGKGLQLINILRDQPGDAAIGRCYLPEAALRVAGLSGEVVWPALDWQPWHVVRRELIGRARRYLADGWTYAASQRSIRLRFATLMPLLIGAGTLQRLEDQLVDQPPAVVKVSRPEVKRMVRKALWMAVTGRIPSGGLNPS